MNTESIEFETPTRLILKGLWFGGKNAKRALVFVHGLTSSAFSQHELTVPLANEGLAVIYFSNRGSESIAKFHRLENTRKGYKSEFIGQAHEVFEECIDDIDGVVNFLKGRGVEEIVLVGHSTGCQKSIYYLSHENRQKHIRGVILMCPMSDYAYAKKFDDPQKLKKAEVLARKFIKEGKSHELLPDTISPELLDAQRFISLNTPGSVENQIFPYFEINSKTRYFQKVTIPMLTIFAQKDEYQDRPIEEIEEWFKKNNKSADYKSVTIKDALHSFSGDENKVAHEARNWTKLLISK